MNTEPQQTARVIPSWEPLLDELWGQDEYALLQRLKDFPTTAIDPDGRTLLMYALQQESAPLPLIQALTHLGSHVNTSDHAGHTPLMAAAANAEPEVLEHLVNQGADPLAVDPNGKTVLMHHLISFEGTSLHVEFLLNLGCDPNAVDATGVTVLMHAAANDAITSKEKSYKALLARGADLEARDKQGRTALFHAVHSGWAINVVELLQLGADINTQDNNGLTALMWALHPDTPAYAALIDPIPGHLHWPEERQARFWREYEWAQKSAVDALLEFNPDLNLTDNEGLTALHYALESPHGRNPFTQ